MPEKSHIDFWFTMGSTYTYLTVMRLAGVQQSTGLSFRWRPFDLLTILKEMKHVPFADKPAKSEYMWRDLERRAEMHGIPIKVPAPYPPRQSIAANRVAIVGLREGWGEDFIRAAYRRWLVAGEEMGAEPNLSASIREAGQDVHRVLGLASEEDVSSFTAKETETARALHIFGSPTFAVGRELFWGDDRLEDAVSWLRHGRVVSAAKTDSKL